MTCRCQLALEPFFLRFWQMLLMTYTKKICLFLLPNFCVTISARGGYNVEFLKIPALTNRSQTSAPQKLLTNFFLCRETLLYSSSTVYPSLNSSSSICISSDNVLLEQGLSAGFNRFRPQHLKGCILSKKTVNHQN